MLADGHVKFADHTELAVSLVPETWGKQYRSSRDSSVTSSADESLCDRESDPQDDFDYSCPSSSKTNKQTKALGMRIICSNPSKPIELFAC